MPYSFANLKMLDNAAYIAYTAIGSNGDSRDGDWADGIASLVSVTSFFAWYAFAMYLSLYCNAVLQLDIFFFHEGRAFCLR